MAHAFFGGVHPNDMKAATKDKAIEQLAAPAQVVIPMSMHIGAPSKPIVAVGDKVKVSFNLSSREFNGRWYTDVRVWRMEPVHGQPVQAAPPMPEPPMPAYDDSPIADLPF